MPTRTPSIDRIALPDAPRIPGVAFRNYRGPSDHPHLVRIQNLQYEADGEPECETAESLDNEFAHLTNCDLAQDLLVAEVEGVPVAWTRVSWDDQNDGSRRYRTFGTVEPTWRRQGIGRALLRWGVARLRVIGEGHAFDGDRWFAGWVSDSDRAGTDLLLEEGFRAVRVFQLMVRPTLDDVVLPPLPAGLEVRPVRASDLRAVYRADCDAFRESFGAVDDSEEAFLRWSRHPATDPGLMVVAWDGDQVASAVICTIWPPENEANGYLRGWLESVFTRRPWRRRGLAGALIGRGLLLLRAQGMTSAQLGVDTQNPNEATRLYASAGFVAHRSAKIYRHEWA